jgi:hypothetical protein
VPGVCRGGSGEQTGHAERANRDPEAMHGLQN